MRLLACVTRGPSRESYQVLSNRKHGLFILGILRMDLWSQGNSWRKKLEFKKVLYHCYIPNSHVLMMHYLYMYIHFFIFLFFFLQALLQALFSPSCDRSCMKMTDCFTSGRYSLKSKLGESVIKQSLNSVIAKYCDLSVSRRSIICLSLGL